MSWVAIALLVCAVAVVVGAELPRLGVVARSRTETRARRDREERKSQLRVIHGDRDEFAESVRRDLDRLPVIEERDDRPRR